LSKPRREEGKDRRVGENRKRRKIGVLYTGMWRGWERKMRNFGSL